MKPSDAFPDLASMTGTTAEPKYKRVLAERPLLPTGAIISHDRVRPVKSDSSS